MAPADVHDLFKRYTYCEDDFGNTYRCSSAWDDWVRWVVLAVIVVVFLFLFMMLSCLSARRRRRQGRQPFYGTSWAAHNYNPPTYQQSQQQPYFTPHNNTNYNPAPPYQQSPSNAGYYGGNRDYELQTPQQAYQPPAGVAHQGEYAPPAGPPPGKR